MLAASPVGILLIPMLYVFFQTLRERTGRKPKAEPAHAPEPEPAGAGTP